MASCPYLFGKVFRHVDVDLGVANWFVQQSMLESVTHKCAWAFKRPEKFPVHIPSACVFLRGKNDYEKAKTIVPCIGHWVKPLHQAVAMVLSDIAQVVYRESSLNMKTTAQACREMKRLN